jgi:DNA-binding beta-propeller fold protein YncE
MILAAMLLCGGCGAQRWAESTYDTVYRWPPQDPRIQLTGSMPLFRPESRERPPGAVDRKISTQFIRPYAIATRGDVLYLTDPGASRIARIEPGSRILWSPPGAFRRPIGVASCPDGIVVTDSEAGTVTLIDEDLRPSRTLADGMDRPTGVACTLETVYVAETLKHRIVLLDRDGTRSHIGGRGEGSGKFNFPTVVAIDDTHNRLLVGDTMNFRIQAFSLESGSWLLEFGRLGSSAGEMPRLKGIVVDAAGQLWVSDAYLNRVSLYNGGGELLISLGSFGSGDTEFSFPAGIGRTADGRIVVVDSYNRRLQFFRNLNLDESDGSIHPEHLKE